MVSVLGFAFVFVWGRFCAGFGGIFVNVYFLNII